MKIDLGVAMFVSLFIFAFILIAILVNLPTVEDWLRRIRGRLPSQVESDVFDYIEEAKEFEREEE